MDTSGSGNSSPNYFPPLGKVSQKLKAEALTPLAKAACKRLNARFIAAIDDTFYTLIVCERPKSAPRVVQVSVYDDRDDNYNENQIVEKMIQVMLGGDI